MITALHSWLKYLPSGTHAIDEVLPRLTGSLQGEFVHWVDGGAGVGTKSRQYQSILAARLSNAVYPAARVYCYEPLPENFEVMSRLLPGSPNYVLRQTALSDQAGEASFVVPTRVKGEAPDGWSCGTSWDGSLQYAAGEDTIAVRTVRLEDEAIPRFDFVKLDLQGGEASALRGMGERITEPKLMYVETQLLSPTRWGNALGYLQEHGFLVFFDRLQFGIRPGTEILPLEVLKKHGIVADRIYLPQDSGVPLTCSGYFDFDAGALHAADFAFRPDVARELADAGVHYMQTDAICVSPRHWRAVAPHLLAG